MDMSVILHELTHADGLPRTALKAADECRAEIAPVFLGELEKYLASSADDRARPTPLFFAFHLFGDLKEKAAYRSLARFLRSVTRARHSDRMCEALAMLVLRYL